MIATKTAAICLIWWALQTANQYIPAFLDEYAQVVRNGAADPDGRPFFVINDFEPEPTLLLQ